MSGVSVTRSFEEVPPTAPPVAATASSCTGSEAGCSASSPVSSAEDALVLARRSRARRRRSAARRSAILASPLATAVGSSACRRTTILPRSSSTLTGSSRLRTRTTRLEDAHLDDRLQALAQRARRADRRRPAAQPARVVGGGLLGVAWPRRRARSDCRCRRERGPPRAGGRRTCPRTCGRSGAARCVTIATCAASASAAADAPVPSGSSSWVRGTSIARSLPARRANGAPAARSSVSLRSCPRPRRRGARPRRVRDDRAADRAARSRRGPRACRRGGLVVRRHRAQRLARPRRRAAGPPRFVAGHPLLVVLALVPVTWPVSSACSSAALLGRVRRLVICYPTPCRAHPSGAPPDAPAAETRQGLPDRSRVGLTWRVPPARPCRAARAARVDLDFAQILDVLADAVTVRDRHDHIVYANRAALDAWASAAWRSCRVARRGDIMADYLVVDEFGRELSMADIPSVRIIRGEPAEPLLMRIVHRQHRHAELEAAEGHAADGRGRRARLHGDDHRGRHRVQERRAAQPLSRRGQRDARLVAGLRPDAAERRLVGRAAARRLVRRRPRRRGGRARARRRRALRPRASGARRAAARLRASQVRGAQRARRRPGDRPSGHAQRRSPTNSSCRPRATTTTSRSCARCRCARC